MQGPSDPSPRTKGPDEGNDILASMTRPLVAAALALVAALAACSSRQIITTGVRLCSQGACKNMEGGSREELARGLYGLFQTASGRELILSEEKPGHVGFRGRGIRVYTQGGPIPAVYKGKALQVTEVSYLDMAEGVVKFKGRMRGTFLFVPVLCSEGEGVVRILPSREARIELSHLCTWLGPTSYWKLDGTIDLVDLDSRILGFHYELRGGGVPVYGRGKGYLLAKVDGNEATE